MPAISANNTALLRQPYHRINNLKLNLFELETTATAKINQSSFTYPLLALAIDNTSAGWTAQNKRFALYDITDSNGEVVNRGVMRDIGSTTLLEIAYMVQGDSGLLTRETALSFADNQDVTVYKTRTPFAFLSRIDSVTGRILKRGDGVWSTSFPQTINIPASGIVNAWQQANADAITGEASFTIDASGSYSWIGGTISYEHTLDTGMTLVSGLTTDASIVIKGTAGQYLHQVRVIDSLNPTAYNLFYRRYLFINDNTIYPAFSDRYATTITSDVHTKTGRQITVTSYGQGAIDKLYVGAPILLTYDVETSADGVAWDSLEDGLGRRTFSGFVKRFEAVRNDADEVIGVTFIVQNVLDYTDNMPIANQYLQGNDTPTYWQEAPYSKMNVAYWVYYVLVHNTYNVLNLFNYDYGDLNVFQRATIPINAGDVKTTLQAQTKLALGNTGVTSDGQITLSRNPVLESTAWRNANPTTFTFNDTDIRDDIEYSRDYLYRVGACEGKFTVYSGSTDSPYRGRWGAFASAQSPAFEQMPDFIALSQNDGLDRIGHRFAEINAPSPEFTLKTRGLIGDFIEPVRGEWIGLNIGAYDPLATGMYDSSRAVPLAVNRVWNFDGAYPTCEIDVSCAPETVGTRATSVPFAVTQGGGSTAYSWSAILDFIYANGGFTAVNNHVGVAMATYTLGVGWQTQDIYWDKGVSNQFYRRASVIQISFASRQLTNVAVTYDLTKGTYDQPTYGAFQLFLNPNSTATYEIANPSLTSGTGLVQSVPFNYTTSTLAILLASSIRTSASYSGSALIRRVEISGLGSNPFAQSGILPPP